MDTAPTAPTKRGASSVDLTDDAPAEASAGDSSGTAGTAPVSCKRPAVEGAAPAPSVERGERSKYFTPLMSGEQLRVYRACVEQGRNVFLTGPGGTGKSFLTREIIAGLNDKLGGGVFVTASTGVAAVNVGGVTLHSWAGFGLCKQPFEELKRAVHSPQKREVKERWLAAKALVVDEVSMVGTELFDKLEAFARYVRGSARPFGGIQLVLVGDFLQLPPVPDAGGAAESAKFVFEGAAWPRLQLQCFELTHIFRQGADPEYAAVLNEIRHGRISERDAALIEACKRVFDPAAAVRPTVLHAHRGDTAAENAEHFARLDTPVREFRSWDTGAEQHVETLNRNCQAPRVLQLRVGAQVMLLRGIPETALVNGSRGVVTRLPERDGEHWAEVRFLDGEVREVKRVEFEMFLGRKSVAKRTQLPLMLAWATTIHKAQGSTLDCVEMALDKAFAEGQVYVALSRATSRSALYVRSFDPLKIKANERVLAFYAQMTKH